MVILIVGRRGAGKTVQAKKIIKGAKNQYILDLYNEYEGQVIKNVENPPNEGIKRVREGAVNNEKFFTGLSKLKNNVIVLEDATIIFNSTIHSEDLKRLIIASRHRRNAIIFLFHSLNRVPLFLYEQANKLILFKTKESARTFRKFEDVELENMYYAIRKEKSNHAFKVLSL